MSARRDSHQISGVSIENEGDIYFNTRREISYLQATLFYFVFLYEHTNDDVFDDFTKIFEHFQKISEDSPKAGQMPIKRFRTFSKIFRR